MAKPYFGNGATKVLHKRGKRNDACRVTEIKRENIENFPSIDAAEKYGYRLCKICFK